MGKKAKKVQKKIPDEEEEEEEVIVQKPKKGQAKSAFDLRDLFSESFRGRLSQYIALNEEVLSTKGSVEGRDNSDQISERKQNMAQRVQNAAADILRLELGELEEWIGEQQVKLSAEIIQLGTVYEETKANLLKTDLFSAEDIAANLALIQSRSDEKQKSYDSYGELIRRSKGIYS